jgi:hypothetical protein
MCAVTVSMEARGPTERSGIAGQVGSVTARIALHFVAGFTRLWPSLATAVAG